MTPTRQRPDSLSRARFGESAPNEQNVEPPQVRSGTLTRTDDLLHHSTAHPLAALDKRRSVARRCARSDQCHHRPSKTARPVAGAPRFQSAANLHPSPDHSKVAEAKRL